MFFSVFIGVIGVLGLYFLVKGLFGWQIGAISSFLMAISFNHFIYPQSAWTDIATSILLVWIFFFIWRGMRENHFLSFAVAGLLAGLSFYINPLNLWFIPIVIILFLNYWSYLKKDFEYSKYELSRNNLLRGFTVLFLTSLAISLPLGIITWQHPQRILIPSATSIFSQPQPLVSFFKNTTETLNALMPAFIPPSIDNFSPLPLVSWPISILAIVGFIKELVHWLKRKHGHFSTSHTFLFVGFVFMLTPGFFSTITPKITLTLGVLPIIFIFASRGIWWIFEKLNHWEYVTHPDKHHLFHGHFAPSVLLSLYVLLGAIGFHELWQYFKLII